MTNLFSISDSFLSKLTISSSPPVSLITKGGDELIVNFDKKESEIENVSLTGPVEEIYKGKIFIN